MKVAVLALTDRGRKTARRLASGLEDASVLACRNRLAETLAQAWQEYDGLVCIMALGIVVRLVAPLLRDKYSDPAVVVCDEGGRYAISALSGHLGGSNDLARKVAAILGGRAVITTASDGRNLVALDLWLRDRKLVVTDRPGLTRVMARLLKRGRVTVFSEVDLGDLPPEMHMVPAREQADLVVTWRDYPTGNGVVVYPRVLVAGIGCNRHTPAREIEEAVREACRVHSLAFAAIGQVATIDLKRDEAGLLAFASNHGYPIRFFHRNQLNSIEGIPTSEPVFRATGAKGVAEPAAILAARGPLLAGKMKWKNVTVALALDYPERRKGDGR